MRDVSTEELFPSYEQRIIAIDGSKLSVWIADTGSKRERGLMHVREIPKDTGMLFLFQNKEMQSFWNKNTLLDLDILWIADGVIAGISALPSVEKSKEIVIVFSPVAADTVLEVSAGWVQEQSISIGNKVSFEEN